VRNLAPEIHRQRAIIEGYPNRPLEAREIKEYLKGLSTALDMTTLTEPVTHRSDTYGEAAWIHWETSGAHFYAWDQPRLFFSVDIYTCKPFDLRDAVSFTTWFFGIRKVEYADITGYDGPVTSTIVVEPGNTFAQTNHERTLDTTEVA
jgi:S-adenosylmethionine decarboxylase